MSLFKKNKRACCFTGHRTVPVSERDGVKVRLVRELEALISDGVEVFIAGGALGFDTMAALAVLELKSSYPEIRLHLALPCENQTKGWSERAVSLYNSIIDRADEVVYTSREYTSGCMHIRNRYMVDNSEVCIAYKTRESGGTAYTVRYALEKGRRIINVAE